MNAKRLAIVMATALLFSLVLACGGSAGPRDFSGSSDSAGGASGGSQTTGGAPDVGSSTAQTVADPTKLIITSSMRLEVKELRDSYVRIGQLARSNGGFVADANIRDDAGSDATASLRLRVPAPRHDETVSSLRGLDGASVKGEETNAKEVTAEFTDLESRLRNLQRSEAQFQQLLTQARTIDEILTVNKQLTDVRGQIEQAQGRLNLLSDQVDLATINVSLTQPAAVARTLPGPLEALASTVSLLAYVTKGLVNVAIVLVIVGIWLLPFGGAWLGGRRLWRRYAPAVKARLG